MGYLGIAFAANVDKGFLRTVQKTAGASNFSVAGPFILWVLISILVLGGIVYLINRFFLNPKDDLPAVEHFDIRDPEKIREILEEADARKSVMEINIPEYRYESFKCLFLEYRKTDNKILLQDPPERGPGHSFENKRVVVNFIINYRDKQKFFSFTTVSEGIVPLRMRGFKQAVVLRLPSRIEIKQRRNSLRLEPPLDYEITIDIIKNKKYHGVKLEDLEFEETARVEDISRDGMRLSYEKAHIFESYKKGDIFAMRFFLNTHGIPIQLDLSKYIYMEVEVVHNNLKRAGRNLLGIRFLRRGTIREEKIFFDRLKALTNEDIHKWITALYARQLRREKGLERKRFEYEPSEAD